MAVLLAGAGLFLYRELGRTLDATMDRGLSSRAADVTALFGREGSELSPASRSPLTERREAFAQVLNHRGKVIDGSPGLGARPLLGPGEVARASKATMVVEHSRGPTEPDPTRLLATPVTAGRRHLIVVVGASMEPTEEAQARFRTLLLIGGPIALLFASLVGYGAAAAALRPVELMRRRARDIQASRPGRRLPVAPSQDEVARLGETLNEMLDRLEDAFARERRFVADASHELRTPLAILKGELELALRGSTDVEGFRLAVSSAAEEADRVIRLAEDLLVIARADQGRLPVRLEPVDAAELLDGVRRGFAARAGDHGVALAIRAPEDLPLTADSVRLGQALGNLVDNALRHGAGSVELVVEPGDGRVRLHVRDDGDGFPDDFLDSAFERFSRADVARGRGGAGLGLAIVQAIARAHGGEAHACNRPSGGADVWLDLPPAAQTVAPAAA
jgi:signal transduction histidine kinase